MFVVSMDIVKADMFLGYKVISETVGGPDVGHIKSLKYISMHDVVGLFYRYLLKCQKYADITPTE